jgi:cytidyltransferase-like protein
MPRYARAVLGGTFDRFHVGHEALLSTAFRLGRTVAIGVTTEAYLAAHPKPEVRRIAPHRVRRLTLSRWLRHHFPGRSFSIHALNDRFGGSVGPGVSVLVVSADTTAGAAAVNVERARLSRRPVPVAVVPLVLADDLRPVSSRRIRAREIDRDGRVLGAIPVELHLDDKAALGWAGRAVRAVFPRARLTMRLAASRLPSRPRTLTAGLRVEVRRRPRGGWAVVEAIPGTTLRARPLHGKEPRALERGLRQLLRPVGRRADPTT